METERSLHPLITGDLRELYTGSMNRLRRYFVFGQGIKWLDCYDIENPLVAALCQGAAMHYVDKVNGIEDFDVWFFYPFNQRYLPFRTTWTWDYKNPKFGRHPSIPGYEGRKIDVLVRSIRNYATDDPVKTMQQYLQGEKTNSSKELAKKAVVILSPQELLGKVAWYMQKG